LPAIFLISFTLKGIPYKCTAIIALGFLPKAILFLMALSNKWGERFQVSLSLSTHIGVAPRYIMGFADAAKVRLWQITSSPWEIPRRIKAVWIAAVPEFNAVTYTPSSIYSPIKSSNLSILEPMGAIQFLLNASVINAFSDPDICGGER